MAKLPFRLVFSFEHNFVTLGSIDIIHLHFEYVNIYKSLSMHAEGNKIMQKNIHVF